MGANKVVFWSFFVGCSVIAFGAWLSSPTFSSLGERAYLGYDGSSKCSIGASECDVHYFVYAISKGEPCFEFPLETLRGNEKDCLRMVDLRGAVKFCAERDGGC
jgi:hypothetical protein